MAMIKRQLRRIGAGKQTKPSLSPLWSLVIDQMRSAKLTKRYRKQYQKEISN
jgi:hypothetical protein